MDGYGQGHWNGRITHKGNASLSFSLSMLQTCMRSFCWFVITCFKKLKMRPWLNVILNIFKGRSSVWPGPSRITIKNMCKSTATEAAPNTHSAHIHLDIKHLFCKTKQMYFFSIKYFPVSCHIHRVLWGVSLDDTITITRIPPNVSFFSLYMYINIYFHRSET